jgi:hypothetical protein
LIKRYPIKRLTAIVTRKNGEPEILAGSAALWLPALCSRASVIAHDGEFADRNDSFWRERSPQLMLSVRALGMTAFSDN